ncbi:MAG: hypothetical protein U0103_10545 [Candidatus Obscuribacterales bacterium]
MYRTKTETKLVWWPTPQDYNEAVQVPKLSVQDPELRGGLPYTNALGLPRSVTGSFASVYRMHCRHKDFALRLFLNNIQDQKDRYALISEFVQHDDLPYTVTFDFLEQGIKIHGDWLPALKMDWLEGAQLDDYIVQHLGDPTKLGALLENFVRMMQDLQRAGIAHGDLQHGNILVCQDELRLVDYDGMFVPAMKGYNAGELGHRNYQHPARAAHHFGPYLDNFSAWIIYASIRALQIDSRLLHQLGGGDDCLLFRQTDFVDPLNSPAFAALERHTDKELNELGQFIRAQIKHDLPDIPFLQFSLPITTGDELHPISDTVPAVKVGARIIRGNLPDWLRNDNAEVFRTAALSSQTRQMPTSASQQAVWIKPGEAHTLTPAQAPTLGRSAKKLNKMTNKINTASIRKQRQITKSKKKQAYLSVVTKQSQPTAQAIKLPPELTTGDGPRKVQWNHNCARLSPAALARLMLLNPLLWIMLNFGLKAFGVDSQLAAQGVQVQAVVTNVQYQIGWLNKYTVVSYTYTLDNQTYHKSEQISGKASSFEKGGQYSITILPWNPFLTETLGAPPGHRRLADLGRFALLLLVNCFAFAILCLPSWKQHKLASRGQAFLAHVDALREIFGDTRLYQADISWKTKGVRHCRTVNVTADEFFRLEVGDREIILVEPQSGNVGFYRFNSYQGKQLSTT